MKRAVYPGSFDPITKGHLDIIERSSKLFEEVIIAVLVNPDKHGLFSIEERVNLIKRSTANFPNIKIESFTGLLINFMKEKEADIIIKGLRAVSDFEYELQMALLNNKLSPEVETIFLMTNENYSCVSSSAVKQIAMFGGKISEFVPAEIVKDIENKFVK